MPVFTSPLVTPESLESGPDQILATMNCGKRGLIYARLADRQLGLCFVDFDGYGRVSRVRGYLKIRPYEVDKLDAVHAEGKDARQLQDGVGARGSPNRKVAVDDRRTYARQRHGARQEEDDAGQQQFEYGGEGNALVEQQDH